MRIASGVGVAREEVPEHVASVTLDESPPLCLALVKMVVAHRAAEGHKRARKRGSGNYRSCVPVIIDQLP